MQMFNIVFVVFYNQRTKISLPSNNTRAPPLHYTVGVSIDLFGPFSMPTYVQEISMFFPNSKSIFSNFCSQALTDGRKDILSLSQNLMLMKSTHTIYKMNTLLFYGRGIKITTTIVLRVCVCAALGKLI